MYLFTLTYTCKYQLSFAPNYKWSECGKCFNSKTNRVIKQIVKSGCIGYIINGKFKSIKFLISKLELIPGKEELPF